MSGLPSKLMAVAVGAAWIFVAVPGVTYAAAAGVTLSIAWFVYKLFGGK